MKKNRILYGFASIIFSMSVLFFYQNCSPQKPRDQPLGPLLVVQTALHWRYTSGTVSPPWQYDVEYDIDFMAKTLSISVSKGSAVTGLPSPGTKRRDTAAEREHWGSIFENATVREWR